MRERAALLRATLLCVLAGCMAQAGGGSDGPTNAAGLIGSGGSKSDSAVDSMWIWPEAEIYMVVDPAESGWTNFWGSAEAAADAATELRDAVDEIAANTPIRVHLLRSISEVEGDYYVRVLEAESDIGGQANVGVLGLAHDLTFKANPGSVRHELGHVAGFEHTHSRTDRDEHIQLHEGYIQPLRNHNFLKNTGGADIGPYDPESIMHYSSYSYTTNSECATITRKGITYPCNLSPEDKITRRQEYSTWNYVAMSALYCDARYCGNRCATAERCADPVVQKNLERLSHWEATGETVLPAAQSECGDGVVEGDEECDSSVSCNADCEYEECGNGVVDPGEACDDGGESATCNEDCSAAECGDGVINRSAGEDCDDARETVNCNANCSIAECGDHIVNEALNEESDDGGQLQTCNADCTLPEEGTPGSEGDPDGEPPGGEPPGGEQSGEGTPAPGQEEEEEQGQRERRDPTPGGGEGGELSSSSDDGGAAGCAVDHSSPTPWLLPLLLWLLFRFRHSRARAQT